jgi:hypothetical protein
MVADGQTGRILGVQCVGPGDVGKQIATAAMVILGKLTVQDLVNADLPCAPPFSLRGYEAQRLLEAHGWNNVRVLEGGVMAWPFGREK